MVTDVKHETQHGVQVDTNPVAYMNEAVGANPQGGSLEDQAQAAGADLTPSSSMTFGDALKSVMNGLGLTNEDLYHVEPTSTVRNSTIQENSDANKPPTNQ